MPSRSVAVTSTLTGPFTVLQISRIPSLNGRPSLATSDGFVVTPSRTPIAWPSRISLMFAVSRKNFIGLPLRPTQSGERTLYLRCGPAPFGHDKIGECSKASDAHFYAILCLKRANSGGSSGENQIAGQQRHHATDV